MSESPRKVSESQEHSYTLNFGEDYEDILDNKDDSTETSEGDIITTENIKRKGSKSGVQVEIRIILDKVINTCIFRVSYIHQRESLIYKLQKLQQEVFTKR